MHYRLELLLSWSVWFIKKSMRWKRGGGQKFVWDKGEVCVWWDFIEDWKTRISCYTHQPTHSPMKHLPGACRRRAPQIQMCFILLHEKLFPFGSHTTTSLASLLLLRPTSFLFHTCSSRIIAFGRPGLVVGVSHSALCCVKPDPFWMPVLLRI